MNEPKTIIDDNTDPGVNRVPSTTEKGPVYTPITLPKYHWVKDKPDPRDHLYEMTGVTQPARVDLRNYDSPIGDQGNLGSCTGNAVAGAIELMDRKNLNKATEVSRLFIYYYERFLEGTVNYDSGAYIRDGIKACYTYGACLENLWPYDITKYRTKPNNTAIADAARRKVTSYTRIADHAGCLDSLANGYPVVIGFTVYSSFESGNWWSTTGIMPYPNTATESVLGGHAVLLVGYDKSVNRYIVRNSWGTGWGDRGYFYMPFQVIQNSSMSSDFWNIKIALDP
jgi:C1A family cysteine protease